MYVHWESHSWPWVEILKDFRRIGSQWGKRCWGKRRAVTQFCCLQEPIEICTHPSERDNAHARFSVVNRVSPAAMALAPSAPIVFPERDSWDIQRERNNSHARSSVVNRVSPAAMALAPSAPIVLPAKSWLREKERNNSHARSSVVNWVSLAAMALAPSTPIVLPARSWLRERDK